MQRHYGTKVLSMTDPPEHTRLRRLVVRSFTPRVLEALRPPIEQLVDDLLAEVEGDAGMDAISQFAYPLPAIVIGKLLGAPEDGREQFMRWSKTIVDFVGTGHADEARARANEQTLAEFRAFLEPIIRDRRAHPREDLISILASSDEGEQLTDDEIVSTCIVLLFAGHETTANLIGNGLLALLRHPDQLELLRAEPERMAEAVEELLRYDSPVQRNRRLAMEDMTFGGKEIAQGDSVLVFMGSANRDADEVRRPGRARHLAVAEPADGLRARHPLLRGGGADAARGADRAARPARPVSERQARRRLPRALASQHHVPRVAVAGTQDRLSVRKDEHGTAGSH